jgi:ABC-type polysaccharide/polyol phosphate export permease
MNIKRTIITMLVIAAALFMLQAVILPRELVDEHIILYIMKLGFLSFSGSVTLTAAFNLIFRRNIITPYFSAFNRYKYLLFYLIKRDFVTRYRRSVLGVVWSVLNPLLTMIVLTVVFSHVFGRFAVDNFPLYLISGQLIFFFFSGASSEAMTAVTGSQHIIKKVYVPKYIFPLAKVASSCVNLAFSLIAFAIVFVATGAQPHWTLLLIPIPIIYTFLFALGVGLLLSAMSVFFQDLIYLYGVFITTLTYFTPIFYPVEILPATVARIMGLNPMYHFVDYMRNLTLYGVVPGLWANIVCLGFSLLAFCIGAYVFISKQDKFVLYL